MTSNRFSLTSLFAFFLLFFVVDCWERSNCKSKTGQNGVCVTLIECPSAYVAVMRTRKHGLTTCGFDGFVEVVCCTDPEVVGDNLGEEKENVWGIDDSSPSTTPVIKTVPKVGVDSSTPPSTATRRRSETACQQYTSQARFNVQFNILNGIEANDGEFPHMAALGYPGDDPGQLNWNCGGTLISNRFVLTAAHCIINTDQIRPTMVRLGSIYIEGDGPTGSTTPQDIPIMNFTIHPEYVRRTSLNDIALIRLTRDVTFDANINAACLYTITEDTSGQKLVVTGWGNIDSEMINRSNILLKATVETVALDTCNSTYVRRNRRLTVKQMCAGSSDGSDSCRGDSGGPLQVFTKDNVYAIVGVISYGIGCGGRTPAIYTRVASYLDWVENVVWPNT